MGKRREFAEARRACGYTQESLAEAIGVDPSTVRRWEAGSSTPFPHFLPKLSKLLGVTRDELQTLLPDDSPVPIHKRLPATDDELAALELLHRVTSSDVSEETLTQLESVVDDLAMAYPLARPEELLERLRMYLAYVNTLLDSRMTLAGRQRLVVVGAWLSLLAATAHIDLNQAGAATARLRVAAGLAKHAGHNEIRAWCYETQAWRVLTEGRFAEAIGLTHAAQALAPVGSGVEVQAAAQEGRAWARLKRPQEAYRVIGRVEKLVSPLQRPEQPEHHYRYDPTKFVAYLATTLAWIGDPEAERFARETITRLTPSDGDGKWPRRVASANLDLALTLVANDRHDEACHAAAQALHSGRVVPSNHWRAAEVVAAVEARGLPEAAGLREAYDGMLRG
ncbi:transcriptional regulator [Actinokineospora iranica]|uniref:Helix-turn-helix n=1 Tax=Actinokineospora iranica TaxID=1271860 RepID=A0A1G6N6Z5_9PSEU|nr:transcriptional regulator [Actinokineospora iranica]SDC63573.1 Helix-turn-helix [Actinokineospora iranica]